MARVKDLWFSKIPVEDANGRVVTERRKTARHPDRGGNKNAKRWLAIWIDPDGSEKSQAFVKQAHAAAHGKRMEADAERGEYVDPRAGREKFGPLAGKFLRLRQVSAGTRKRYEGILANHVDPVFAHRTVKGIKPSEIIEWLQGPLSSYSASLQETAFIIVRGTFDLAVADKLRHGNPARSPIVPVPHDSEVKPRAAWGAETVWKIIDEHPDRYRAIPVCEAGLGLREGCAFGLAEEDIDFEAGKVTVRRQVVRYGGQAYFKAPKGGKERTVPLPRGVAAYVRAHIGKYPPQPVTLPWMGEDGKVADDPHTCRLLFTWHGPRSRGKPVSAQSYIDEVWNPALSRAGIAPPPEKNKRGYLRYRSGGWQNGQHALRHFYETTLDGGGVSLAGQMEFLGHSRKGKVITIAVYSHVTEETFERGRQAVDSTLFRLRPIESDGTVPELRSAQ